MRVEGPIVVGVNAVFLTDWYSETGEAARCDEIVPLDARRRRRSDARLPGRAERPRVRGREQPAAVPRADLRAPQERIIITSPYFVPDEAMLCAITTAVPARRRRRAVRLGDRRPGARLPRAALATTRRCCAPACRSGCTRRRTSCTPSTSRSTTTSRSSARATWTCARSASTWRSRCSCAARSFVAQMREVEDGYRDDQPRAHARGVGEAAAALHGARQPRAADLGAAVAERMPARRRCPQTGVPGGARGIDRGIRHSDPASTSHRDPVHVPCTESFVGSGPAPVRQSASDGSIPVTSDGSAGSSMPTSQTVSPTPTAPPSQPCCGADPCS